MKEEQRKENQISRKEFEDFKKRWRDEAGHATQMRLKNLAMALRRTAEAEARMKKMTAILAGANIAATTVTFFCLLQKSGGLR